MSDINKAIKLAKYAVLTNKQSNSGFLGYILTTTDIVVDDRIPTAATDGKSIFINEKWFLDLSLDERISTLCHELWHIALLHFNRGKDKDPQIWNQAGDYYINNMLKNMDYKLPEGALVDKYENLVEENIYDILYKNFKKNFSGGSGNNSGNSTNNSAGSNGQSALSGDLLPISKSAQKDIVNKVQQAVMLSKKCGRSTQAGSGSEAVEELLKKYCRNKVDWRKELWEFFTEVFEKDVYSWKRPNRRFQDIYLPSLEESEGKLTHLYFFIDTSGSITDEQIKAFHAELQYIHSEFKPDKLTIVQFDTRILKEDTIEGDDDYLKVAIVPGGGTSYTCITKYLNKLKEVPSGVIILTDLYCDPMKKPKRNIPVLWVSTELENKEIPFGKWTYLDVNND